MRVDVMKEKIGLLNNRKKKYLDSTSVKETSGNKEDNPRNTNKTALEDMDLLLDEDQEIEEGISDENDNFKDTDDEDTDVKFNNFDVKDEPRSGRPITDKIDAILKKVKQDKHISFYDIAEEPGD
ncbi:hypothetical protein EVAR_51225_1 [Eumeta japonica]|uniref:Uncharacterized protein n=1 Tax=Eumeta variegata TaxID=151549 RepID=A0A4C1Z937_EUMVA|nr:hypothetical protein EVAR_51225_1 [Eumeta japonica]